MIRKSLSLEISSFVDFFRKNLGTTNFKSFTKSAFVQCRKKINPEVFKHLSSILIDEFYTDNDAAVKLWNGFRLLAVDGSRVTLPNTRELRKLYGVAKNQSKTGVTQARVSILYDVLNNYTLDGLLSPLKTGEITLAYRHLEHCKIGDLVLYDRGYPSYDLMFEHFENNINFLIRARHSFNNVTKEFINSNKHSSIVKFYPVQNSNISDKPYNRDTPIEVRLIRVKLPSGEIELLITSLLDSKHYPISIFKELYFKRWKIETFYDELKNKLKIEHFTGYSNQTILQDFYATLFVSDVQTLIVSELEDELNECSKGKKYKYKVNTNLSYGFLKNRVISLFFSNSNIGEVTKELKSLFKENLVPVRPYRTNKRNIGKYSNRLKPKVTKNQKDTL